MTDHAATAESAESAAEMFSKIRLLEYPTVDEGSADENIKNLTLVGYPIIEEGNVDKKINNPAPEDNPIVEDGRSADKNMGAWISTTRGSRRPVGLFNLPVEILHDILSISNVKTVARFQQVSRKAQEVAKSSYGFETFRKRMPVIMRYLDTCRQAVYASKVDNLPMTIPVETWNYRRVASSHMSARCLLCEEEGLGRDPNCAPGEVVNATDGLRVCHGHMKKTPEYYLGLDLTRMLRATIGVSHTHLIGAEHPPSSAGLLTYITNRARA
jgi:hypothetical protein